MSVEPDDGATSSETRLRPGLAFDAPTATEWTAWWTTPRPARAYVTVLVALAGAVTVGGTLAAHSSASLWMLAGLVAAGMANVELGRMAEGGRVERQRIHKGLSAWVFAAALLLGPGLAGWVAAASFAHADLRGMRIRRWKWIGSGAIVALAGFATSVAFGLVTGGRLPASGSVTALAGVLVAVAVFLGVEAALYAVISRLNSEEDEVYLRAQLASRSFYLIEGAVLLSGAVAAVLLRYSPGFLLLAAPAYLLMQRGMLHRPLQHEARHDAKTGVLNSEAWRVAAAAAIREQRRQGGQVAVLIVDIDHFKKVNDTFGHLLGDDVLTATADAVARCVRHTDVVGRFGGDEFCALLSGTTFEEAMAAAERIRDQIGQLPFTDGALRVTASVGMAVVDAGAADLDLPGLVGAADRALYAAKSAGRNQVSNHTVPRRPPAARSA